MLSIMSVQSHRSNPAILNWRTVERDHRILAGLLRPGMSVLDIGCGTGTITVGIAKAVGPEGKVIGVDRDEALLDIARSQNASLVNLRFERSDATQLAFQSQFDIVNASRVLQWIDGPAKVIAAMREAARSSGLIVVLDYNHSLNCWEPEPPNEFKLVYHAFLAWRDANHWDNEMGDHLSDLFRAAGLMDVRCEVQDEITIRGEPDFAERSSLWSGALEAVGAQLTGGGFCSEAQLQQGLASYDLWIKSELMKQTLSMRAVVGVAP